MGDGGGPRVGAGRLMGDAGRVAVRRPVVVGGVGFDLLVDVGRRVRVGCRLVLVGIHGRSSSGSSGPSSGSSGQSGSSSS